MKTLGIIPARYASTRLPGKPLLEIGGKSIIQRVYEQAKKASLLDDVIVATDDEKIFNHIIRFGGAVQMTANTHQSGTDRCAEIATELTDYQLVVNIQGDEPFIQPEQLDLVIKPFLEKPTLSIVSLAKKINEKEELFNSNIVKVVFGSNQDALYFSRSPIPHVRNSPLENWLEKSTFYKHIGLYAFRRQVLEQVARLPVSFLEESEALEQLRWLESGYQIHIVETDQETIGIDTASDLEKAQHFITKYEK